MPLANANAANAPGRSAILGLFYNNFRSCLPPSLLPFYWFHHPRIIVGIIRRTFNLVLIRPQSSLSSFLFAWHLSQMKYYKRQRRKKREEENGGKSQTNCAQQSPRIFSSLAKRKLHCRVGVLFFSPPSLAFLSILLLLFAYFSGTT